MGIPWNEHLCIRSWHCVVDLLRINLFSISTHLKKPKLWMLYINLDIPTSIFPVLLLLFGWGPWFVNIWSLFLCRILSCINEQNSSNIDVIGYWSGNVLFSLLEHPRYRKRMCDVICSMRHHEMHRKYKQTSFLFDSFGCEAFGKTFRETGTFEGNIEHIKCRTCL
mgnify:CR=1 FL=1